MLCLALPLLLAATFGSRPAVDTSTDDELVAGLPSSEALRLGERMYRDGILPSGKPMLAFVQGDIEVEGTMFTCQSCHLRSGMGSLEGTVITQPTTGTWLYKPLVGAEMKPESQAHVPKRLDPPPFRPAYTDAKLARAIWSGKDAGGRTLHPAMPRYKLSIANMAILIHYLKNLSVGWSPGVDDTTLRFATVVSEDVNEVDRQAMVNTLKAYVRDHNSQSRHQERRAAAGPFYKEEKNLPYRRYSLDVWELTGDRATWPAQLDAYLRKAPVFALIGGLISGEWAPVHEFCERHHLPCLFPVTDFPVISETDWYTMYFSKGFYQEGETAAAFLRRSDRVAADTAVVQVFRDNATGQAFARGFAEERESMGLAPAIDLVLPGDQPPDEGFLPRLARKNPGAVLVLWLDPACLVGLEQLIQVEQPPSLVIVSTSLLGESVSSLAEPLRSITYVTHPYSFPENERRTRLSVQRWLEAKGLPITNFSIQAKMYLVGWTLSGITKRMRDDFYRDYFLDIVGMMRDQYYAIAVYPRLSFGPGQRYAAKGCYMAKLSSGEKPKLVQASNWVIH